MFQAPCHSFSRKKDVPASKLNRSAKRGVRKRTSSPAGRDDDKAKQQPTAASDVARATRRRSARRRSPRASPRRTAPLLNVATAATRHDERDGQEHRADAARPPSRRSAHAPNSASASASGTARSRIERKVVRRAVERRDAAHALRRPPGPAPTRAATGRRGSRWWRRPGVRRQAARPSGDAGRRPPRVMSR